jgi:predicted ferric reductase
VDRLARMHRVVGLLSFSLLITHIVLIIAGYASGQWSAVLSTIWDLITSYGGMLLAVAGTACLIMVVVTSLRAARRRLRYESWHLLHLYGYLGVGLALPHQLWTGQEFLQSAAATVYWWTLWAAAAAAVVVWRVWLPLWRSARYRLRVAGVVGESSEVVSVYLTGHRLDRLPLRAGQFITIRFLSRPGWTRANPFSLSVAPNSRTLRITAKALGEGSTRLAHLRPGTWALFEGPYGRLSSRARTQPKVLLAGAGVGITPLRALAEGLEYAPGEAIMLQRYTAEPLFKTELERTPPPTRPRLARPRLARAARPHRPATSRAPRPGVHHQGRTALVRPRSPPTPGRSLRPAGGRSRSRSPCRAAITHCSPQHRGEPDDDD